VLQVNLAGLVEGDFDSGAMERLRGRTMTAHDFGHSQVSEDRLVRRFKSFGRAKEIDKSLCAECDRLTGQGEGETDEQE
jgi:hypothetical protein